MAIYELSCNPPPKLVDVANIMKSPAWNNVQQCTKARTCAHGGTPVARICARSMRTHEPSDRVSSVLHSVVRPSTLRPLASVVTLS